MAAMQDEVLAADTYLVLPDGTVCWAPGEEDYELFREECRELVYEDDWD